MPKNLYREKFGRVMGKPVFGVRDLADLGVPRKYAGLRLHQLAASGKIFRAERGKYTASDDPVLVATHLTEPCYLTLWSAMSARGLTTQVPFSIQVATSRKRYARQIDFLGNEIRFYQLRPGMMFGYEYVAWGSGHRIPMARVEKVIIDAIYLGEIPPGEMEDAVKGADREVLDEYSKLTGNRRVMAAVKELLKC